jgi:hypothetical protein
VLVTRLLAVATLSLSVFAATAVSAQEQRGRGNDACTGDAGRICKKFFGQGDMVILKCFQDNRTKLSGKCRKFLTNIGQLN